MDSLEVAAAQDFWCPFRGLMDIFRCTFRAAETAHFLARQNFGHRRVLEASRTRGSQLETDVRQILARRRRPLEAKKITREAHD